MIVKKMGALILVAIVITLCACAPEHFRLHILANSNSGEDQQVKLAVRDAVLKRQRI